MDIFRIGNDPNENLKRRTKKEYATGKMHGYYLLGIPYLGEKPTDTESWFMSAIKALLAPLTFGVKLVPCLLTDKTTLFLTVFIPTGKYFTTLRSKIDTLDPLIIVFKSKT